MSRHLIGSTLDDVKSRFTEMFGSGTKYPRVPLREVISQYYCAEKIDHPESESYITLSSYGKGIKRRVIKDGKVPVPFVGCRIKEGQFVSSRLHAKEGAFGLVSKELDGCVVSRDFPVFDINNDKIVSKFLLVSVSQEGFYNQFLNYSFGSTTKRRIKEDVFLDFEIVLPPIEEQERFVDYYEQAFLVKTRFNSCFEKYDQLVKSRFTEMFGSMEKVSLTELASITMGQSPDSSSYNSECRGVPFFQGKAEFGDVFVSENMYCDSPKKMARAMDILMSVRAPVGSVNIAPMDCCIGRGLAAIASYSGRTNVWFLFYALRMIENEIESMGVGSTFKAISKSDMVNIHLPMPPFDLQNQFAEFVKQVDKSKFRLIESLQKLKTPVE